MNEHEKPKLPPCAGCGERSCRLCETCEALANMHCKQGDECGPASVLTTEMVREVLAEVRAEANEWVRRYRGKGGPGSVYYDLCLTAGGGWAAVGEVARRLGLPQDEEGARVGQGCIKCCVNEQACPDDHAYDEPRNDAPPGTCPGCDLPADGSQGHRFACTIHGKKQVVLTANPRSTSDGHHRVNGECAEDCPGCESP